MQVKLCVFLILLLVTPNMAVQQHSHFSRASEAALQKLKAQKGTWASFLVNLAEVHLASGGPLDQLIDAIEEVLVDLDAKLIKAHENFNIRTNQHVSEVTRVQSLIDSAASDVASTTEQLVVLDLQLSSLQEDVVNLEKALVDNNEAKVQSIAVRAAQNAIYVEKVPEHQEAISTIDQALEVLSQLVNGDSFIQISLVQVQALRKNFDTINKKIPSGKDSSILKALMQVAADAKFADQAAIQQVVKMMREVRQNLSSSLAKLEEEETAQTAQHSTDLFQFANNSARLSTELAETNEAIQSTLQFIADSQEFLAQRSKDKQTSEKDLQDENDSYQRDTESYENLVAQFENELNACNLALDHLNSSDVADFIGQRMSQDKVIDTQHGAGFNVEKNIHDLE